MSNNFVAMEQNMCPVCGMIHTHNTGILINKHLQEIHKDKTITDYGLCEEHDKLFQEGYIALIVADENSHISSNGNLKMENANRTGELVHMKRDVFNDILSTKISNDQEMIFIDKELFDKLNEMSIHND